MLSSNDESPILPSKSQSRIHDDMDEVEVNDEIDLDSPVAAAAKRPGKRRRDSSPDTAKRSSKKHKSDSSVSPTPCPVGSGPSRAAPHSGRSAEMDGAADGDDTSDDTGPDTDADADGDGGGADGASKEDDGPSSSATQENPPRKLNASSSSTKSSKSSKSSKPSVKPKPKVTKGK